MEEHTTDDQENILLRTATASPLTPLGPLIGMGNLSNQK